MIDYEQISFSECTTKNVSCDKCLYGRNLGGKDYGCVNTTVYSLLINKVHKGDYVCGCGVLKE